MNSDFFAKPVVEEHPVEINGVEEKLWFRKVSAYDWSRYLHHLMSGDVNQRASAQYVLIAASVADPDGKQAMTVEEAQTLRPEVAEPLYKKVSELNNWQKKVEAKGNA